MGKHSIERQMIHQLSQRMAIGESKHQDKHNMDIKVGESTYKIYSYSTRDTYEQAARQYCRWLHNEKGLAKSAPLRAAKSYAKEYLEHRTATVSAYTVARDRSALGMIFKETINIRLPQKERTEITRSRGEVANDRHFSEERNRALSGFCRNTGLRRHELATLRVDQIREVGGKMILKDVKGKGGRVRDVVVLDRERVREIVADSGKSDHDRLFDRVHSAADIHSYRREYAQALYERCQADHDFREGELYRHPDRSESVKSDTYTTKDRECEYSRDSLYVCSENLGHNRLGVVVNHYLR